MFVSSDISKNIMVGMSEKNLKKFFFKEGIPKLFFQVILHNLHPNYRNNRKNR